MYWILDYWKRTIESEYGRMTSVSVRGVGLVLSVLDIRKNRAILFASYAIMIGVFFVFQSSE